MPFNPSQNLVPNGSSLKLLKGLLKASKALLKMLKAA